MESKRRLSRKHRERMKKIRVMSFAAIATGLFFVEVLFVSWLGRYSPEMQIGGGEVMVVGMCILSIAYAGSERVISRMMHKSRLARRFKDRS